LHIFWHLENQLLFLCNYVSETVKHTVKGFKEYSGQNTEDSTALQYSLSSGQITYAHNNSKYALARYITILDRI